MMFFEYVKNIITLHRPLHIFVLKYCILCSWTSLLKSFSCGIWEFLKQGKLSLYSGVCECGAREQKEVFLCGFSKLLVCPECSNFFFRLCGVIVEVTREFLEGLKSLRRYTFWEVKRIGIPQVNDHTEQMRTEAEKQQVKICFVS
jgi:hypothetical protein